MMSTYDNNYVLKLVCVNNLKINNHTTENLKIRKSNTHTFYYARNILFQKSLLIKEILTEDKDLDEIELPFDKDVVLDFLHYFDTRDDIKVNYRSYYYNILRVAKYLKIERVGSLSIVDDIKNRYVKRLKNKMEDKISIYKIYKILNNKGLMQCLYENESESENVIINEIHEINKMEINYYSDFIGDPDHWYC